MLVRRKATHTDVQHIPEAVFTEWGAMRCDARPAVMQRGSWQAQYRVRSNNVLGGPE